MVLEVLYGLCVECNKKGLIKEVEIIKQNSKIPIYEKEYFCLKCSKGVEK